MKTESIAIMEIGENKYSIRATAHALSRMAERKIDKFVVAGNVLALGAERIKELQAAQEEAVIIDDAKKISVVIAFKGNKIQVVTVIDKANIFVKKGTTVERI